ncbi:MAG: T9SS type A sorting domain-containing protein [Bacteroidota bacterium]|nr:T9SS type A sorting domain-containing protein [Bacteroidota bacterium]
MDQFQFLLICVQIKHNVTASAPPGTTFSNWTVTGNATIWGSGSSASISTGYNFTGGQVRVTLSNVCGGPLTIVQSLYSNPYNCGNSYSVSPNPAEDEFEVSTIYSDTANTNSEEIEYALNLYNHQQILVKSMKSNEKSVKIITHDLKKGRYFLHILDKNGVHIKQIIIDK